MNITKLRKLAYDSHHIRLKELHPVKERHKRTYKIKAMDTKMKFEAPKITQSVGLELERELLSLSDPEFNSSIQATGHERVEVTGIDSYWEE